ncbi:hypothetical protein Hanom_Chr03g00273371 [Helianthus anomalus]
MSQEMILQITFINKQNITNTDVNSLNAEIPTFHILQVIVSISYPTYTISGAQPRMVH